MHIVTACLCLLAATISAANASDMCGQFKKEYSFSTKEFFSLNLILSLEAFFLSTASSAMEFTTTLTSEPSASTVRNDLSTPGTTVGETLTPPPGWISWNGTMYYKVFSVKKNYNNAENTCDSYGARLAAVIVRDATDELFPRLEENELYWVGLQDRVKEGVFLWSDNYTYVRENTSWRSDHEPNNYDNEDCVEIRKERLNDHKCSKKFGFICERRFPEL